MIDSRTSGAVGGAASGAKAGAVFGPYGMAIGAVAGGLLGGFMGGGEDDAQKLADKQAEMIEEARNYNRRRDLLEMGQTVGYARAAIGASNIQFGGSSGKYVNKLESTFRQDIAWKDYKAKREAELTREGGQFAADQIGRAGLGSMVASLGSAAQSGTFGTVENGTYKSPWE